MLQMEVNPQLNVMARSSGETRSHQQAGWGHITGLWIKTSVIQQDTGAKGSYFITLGKRRVTLDDE